MAESPLASLFERTKEETPDFGARPVFDVGANRGQSYAKLRRLLPEAQIHCFEPAPATFDVLRKAVGDDERTILNRHALGATRGNLALTTGLGSGNHLIKNAQAQGDKQVTVDILTGDQYCLDHEINQIDFLKIDTEGHDLDVLVGFSDALRHARISYLQVETSVNLDNRFHVHLERFIHFLHPFGYRMCDLTEPVRHIHKTNQKMRGIWYCNAIFAKEVDQPNLRRDGVN